ncbi:dihydrofolate reductase family protein [uncultured Roseobacter sp.]|uniref:dihydrofolate reductase family protein n=1 Tax=uncultured Roseobacter sp. TaxID=114847 RepID=UPI0026192D06|nr:dihydrofolate reductase family protein [uncultured Roseobacter sp.]
MQPIVYDVAVSADGFIAGPGNDVSAFPNTEQVVEDYFARLSTYKTVLMGRATYEVGYDFGLKPGENPYPKAASYVVSQSIRLPDEAAVVVRRALDDAWLSEVRNISPSPIYLCGGGILATALLELGHLQGLRLKRAPIVLGSGTPLFAPFRHSLTLKLRQQTDYGDGYLFQDFDILT